jgi:hypothetical protein
MIGGHSGGSNTVRCGKSTVRCNLESSVQMQAMFWLRLPVASPRTSGLPSLMIGRWNASAWNSTAARFSQRGWTKQARTFFFGIGREAIFNAFHDGLAKIIQVSRDHADGTIRLPRPLATLSYAKAPSGGVRFGYMLARTPDYG